MSKRTIFIVYSIYSFEISKIGQLKATYDKGTKNIK